MYDSLELRRRDSVPQRQADLPHTTTSLEYRAASQVVSSESLCKLSFSSNQDDLDGEASDHHPQDSLGGRGGLIRRGSEMDSAQSGAAGHPGLTFNCDRAAKPFCAVLRASAELEAASPAGVSRPNRLRMALLWHSWSRVMRPGFLSQGFVLGGISVRES